MSTRKTYTQLSWSHSKKEKSKIRNLKFRGLRSPEHRTLPEKKIWNGKFRGLRNTNGAPLRYPTIKNATSEHQLGECKKSKVRFLGVFGTTGHWTLKMKKIRVLVFYNLWETGDHLTTEGLIDLGVQRQRMLPKKTKVEIRSPIGLLMEQILNFNWTISCITAFQPSKTVDYGRFRCTRQNRSPGNRNRTDYD